jgi:hypothetical protein
VSDWSFSLQGIVQWWTQDAHDVHIGESAALEQGPAHRPAMAKKPAPLVGLPGTETAGEGAQVNLGRNLSIECAYRSKLRCARAGALFQSGFRLKRLT